MGHFVRVFSESPVGIVAGGCVNVSQGQFGRKFLSLHDIRVDENLSREGEVITTGYIRMFPNQPFWEHQSILLNVPSSGAYQGAILLAGEKHLFLLAGVPKLYQGVIFHYNGERIKMI